MKISIKILENRNQLAMEAATIIHDKARSPKRGGSFFWCLSGGGTPLKTYSHLTNSPFSKTMPWERFRIFWGDERLVHPSQPESNFGQAQNALLQKAHLSKAHMHPMPTDSDNPAINAQKYEKTLRQFWPDTDPKWDIAMLGLGVDGHTASLFANSPALNSIKLVENVEPPFSTTPFLPRLTLTPKAFSRAGCILFLVTGPAKARAVAQTLALCRAQKTSRDWPASFITTNGEVIWLLDQAAAAELSK